MPSVVSILKKSLGKRRTEENKATEMKVLPLFFCCQSCISESTDPAAGSTKTPASPSPATNPLTTPACLSKSTDPAEDSTETPASTTSATTLPSTHVAATETKSALDSTNQSIPKHSIPNLKAFGESKRNVLCTTFSEKTAHFSNVRAATPPRSRSAFSLNLSMLLQRKGNARVFLLSTREKERVRRDMNTDFTENVVQQMKHTNATEAHLFAARQLVWQFWALDEMIQTKTRMPETTREVIFAAMETFLYPRLSALYSLDDFHYLTPHDAALLVSWMDDFCRAVVEHATGVELKESWHSDCEKLASFYLDKAVRQKMRACLARAFAYQTDDDIREDGNGHMVTELSQQVSYLVEQQISVAQEVLPRRYLPQVLSVCNQEISLFVSNVQLQIGSSWRVIRVSLYCAFINDAFRLVEQCEERNEKYLDSDIDEKQLEEARQLIKDLAELSLHATDYLCQRIMLYLCRPQSDILTSVGDAVWERDESSNAVECTIETLKDFFVDLERWLISDYYFVKVLKECFQLVIRLYLESFFGSTLVRGVQNARAVSRELGKDYVRLANFFNGEFFEKYRNFYTKEYVNNELRILQHMAAIVLPENDPDFCREDILAILRRCSSEEGSVAVLHLAGLRKQNIRGAESASWVKAIASAKKDIAEREASAESKEGAERLKMNENKQAVIHIPDLRNSKFVGNIYPVRLATLDRYISEGTMDYAQSTMRLLDKTNRDPAIIKQAKDFTRGIGAGFRSVIQY